MGELLVSHGRKNNVETVSLILLSVSSTMPKTLCFVDNEYNRPSTYVQDAWALRNEWALVGHGLDFVDDDDAKAQTPDVTVVARPAAGKQNDEDENKETLANTVFVAADSRRRSGSSQHSSSNHPPYPFSQHPGAHKSYHAPR